MRDLKLPMDLTGLKINNLEVLRVSEKHEHGRKDFRNKYYLCKCVCGKELHISRDSLKGDKLSCGCIPKPHKNPIAPTVPPELKRLRRIWHGMKEHCYNENHKSYVDYGAKGITLCERWLDFENFKEDMYESYLKFELVNGHNTATIDRIDNNNTYNPTNCRWLSRKDQLRNTSRNIAVEIDDIHYPSLGSVAEEYNIPYKKILQRYRRGLRGSDLINTSNLKKR